MPVRYNKSRILIHDYSGHAFTIQLARWLAKQGFEAHYWFSNDIGSPKGTLDPQPDDPPNLCIKAISGGEEVKKYAPLLRLKQELAYGDTLATEARDIAPAITLSNAPPPIQAKLRNATKTRGVFITWMQDIYSLALRHLLMTRSPTLSTILSPIARAYEDTQLRASDAVICISKEFRRYCELRGVAPERCAVIENWAALGEIPMLPKDNRWSRENGLHDKFVFLFSGTLGLKHDPEIFVRLAQSLEGHRDAACVVVSEGSGRAFLEKRKRELNLENLRLYSYQKHVDFPQLLAAGDVLIAILEPFASELSVPSKVLAYFCAGRPLLAAIPSDNHSAQLVDISGAGLLTPPGDREAFLRAAHVLMKDGALRQQYGSAARNFAERTFDIDRIGRDFISVFERMAPRPSK